MDQCDPLVEQLPQLVSQLNKSNNFSSFVRAVRRGFADGVATEMHAAPVAACQTQCVA